jgi:hypothetical protein
MFDQGVKQRSVWMMDTTTNEWSILPPMPQACSGHSCAVLNGFVYFVGASDSGDVLRFDTDTGLWSRLAPTSHSLHSGACFVLGGCLYAVGGVRDGTSLERRNSFGAVAIGPAVEQDVFDTLIAKAIARNEERDARGGTSAPPRDSGRGILRTFSM